MEPKTGSGTGRLGRFRQTFEIFKGAFGNRLLRQGTIATAFLIIVSGFLSNSVGNLFEPLRPCQVIDGPATVPPVVGSPPAVARPSANELPWLRRSYSAAFNQCGPHGGGVRLAAASFWLVVSIAALVPLGLSLYWLSRLAGRVLTSGANITHHDQEPPKKVLIMALSRIGDRKAHDAYFSQATSFPEEKLVRTCQAKETPDKPWNWRQNLRSIKYHLRPEGQARPALEKIFVVTSADKYGEEGSQNQFFQSDCQQGFQPLLDALLPELEKQTERRKVDVERLEPVDFEDYADVYKRLKNTVERCTKGSGGYKEKDICIDITSGIKVFSIAAAAVTFNTDAKFSYVRDDGSVSFYDASITTALFGGS